MTTYICKKCKVSGNSIINVDWETEIPASCPYDMEDGAAWEPVENEVETLLDAIDDNSAVAQYLEEAGVVDVLR